jgi:Lar family restriction alleviation protein
MTEMAPCPFCGSVDLYVMKGFPSYRVECSRCDAHGPSVHAKTRGDNLEELAIIEWNSREK